MEAETKKKFRLEQTHLRRVKGHELGAHAKLQSAGMGARDIGGRIRGHIHAAIALSRAKEPEEDSEDSIRKQASFFSFWPNLPCRKSLNSS